MKNKVNGYIVIIEQKLIDELVSKEATVVGVLYTRIASLVSEKQKIIRILLVALM